MKDTFLKPNIQLFAEGDANPDNGGNNANQDGGNGSEPKTYTQERCREKGGKSSLLYILKRN